MTEDNPNRKTGIPVKTIPDIVSWLLSNCTKDEIYFMADLATNSKKFMILNSIITRLTDYNIHEVFYQKFATIQELSDFRAAKRGEVAGLKALSMACQAAKIKIERRLIEKKKKGSD
jgi:hypothetical protein